MSFYSRSRKTATKLITKYGFKYQCIRKGSVTVVNGVEVETQDEQFSIIGIKSNYSLKEIDGTTIQSGDMQLTCTYDHDLQINDIVIIDDERYLVKEPNPVKPADILICYKAQLRKA